MTIEHAWIKHLQRHWPKEDFGHDTFYDPQTREIVTSDMLVEEVHFSLDYYQPEDVGWKSIAVNLSDIAATGGLPKWALVNVGIPNHHPLSILERIYSGIEACCRKYRCRLVGGDTVHADKITLSVTIVGTLPEPAIPGRRNRTLAGDIIVTSGLHGLSQAGMVALQHQIDGFPIAKEAHLRPKPQIRLGTHISRTLPRFSMMDSSDGLADAVLHFAEINNVDIILSAQTLKIHPEVDMLAHHMQMDPMDWILYGGEDFQLIMSLPAEVVSLFPGIKPIGKAVPARSAAGGHAFINRNHELIPLNVNKTFQHFAPPVTSSGQEEGEELLSP